MTQASDYSNEWSKWASVINDKVFYVIKTDKGDDVNAYYCLELANHVLNNIKWLPLWSNIFYNRFKFGRLPATSAAVEIEFGLLKNHVLKIFFKPIRADLFLQTYLNYIMVKIKITNAALNEKREDPKL